jgi:acetyltransferase
MILALRDGTRVPAREIRAEDAPALLQLVERSLDRSVELRFFGPRKELSEEEAQHFAKVDGKDRFALVALDPDDETVAVVRYERERDTDGAEYATLVVDRFQDRELGTILTERLVEAARKRGVKRLHALIMRENADMPSLLRDLSLSEQASRKDGFISVVLDL